MRGLGGRVGEDVAVPECGDGPELVEESAAVFGKAPRSLGTAGARVVRQSADMLCWPIVVLERRVRKFRGGRCSPESSAEFARICLTRYRLVGLLCCSPDPLSSRWPSRPSLPAPPRPLRRLLRSSCHAIRGLVRALLRWLSSPPPPWSASLPRLRRASMCASPRASRHATTFGRLPGAVGNALHATRARAGPLALDDRGGEGARPRLGAGGSRQAHPRRLHNMNPGHGEGDRQLTSSFALVFGLGPISTCTALLSSASREGHLCFAPSARLRLAACAPPCTSTSRS